VNRYEIDDAVHKVRGYIIPAPLENPESAFRRARIECLAALRRELEFVEQLSFEQFKGVRRSWRRPNLAVSKVIAESERLIAESAKTGDVEDWHSLEWQRNTLLAALKDLVSPAGPLTSKQNPGIRAAIASVESTGSTFPTHSSGACQVTVATYENRGGVDTRVFSEPELAVRWKAQLAEILWDQKLRDVPKPSREAMGAEYFDLVEGEFFESQVCDVETAAEMAADADASPGP